jgi:hypothetical protein
MEAYFLAMPCSQEASKAPYILVIEGGTVSNPDFRKLAIAQHFTIIQ